MSVMEYAGHWYDGFFYDLFMGPFHDELYVQVNDVVTEGSSFLEIGCGTGRLASRLLHKCERIEIVDPSWKNIEIARRRLADAPSGKVVVAHSDALRFVLGRTGKFDFAFVSYIIHRIKEDERDVLLWALSSAAYKIILVDYLVPTSINYCGMVNHIAEYAAGVEHFRNFRSYVRRGGLNGLLESVPLRVISETRNSRCSGHIVLLEGKNGSGREVEPDAPVSRGLPHENRSRRASVVPPAGEWSLRWLNFAQPHSASSVAGLRPAPAGP